MKLDMGHSRVVLVRKGYSSPVTAKLIIRAATRRCSFQQHESRLISFSIVLATGYLECGWLFCMISSLQLCEIKHAMSEKSNTYDEFAQNIPQSLSLVKCRHLSCELIYIHCLLVYKLQTHKIKLSYKSLAAIPTNTLLLDQQVSSFIWL